MFLSLLVGLALTAPKPVPAPASNVFLVMTDGLRWQEVFEGADPELLKTIHDPSYKAAYGGDTAEVRRRKLMPFLWSVVAKQGTLFGNRNLGSRSQVANPLKFTYPGFGETVNGFPDPRINSNSETPNPDVTVFEWISRQPGFKGKVASFGASSLMGAVMNRERCGFFNNSGYEPITTGKLSDKIQYLNEVKQNHPRYWDDEAFDFVEFDQAFDYIRLNRPRLVFLSLGETDEWAHESRYDLYLDAIHRYDAYLAKLWQLTQTDPFYKRTAMIMSCDHGRGVGPQWIDHSFMITRSEETWITMVGAGVQAIGESRSGTVTNSQVAATIAKLLGYDFSTFQPKAAPPIDALK